MCIYIERNYFELFGVPGYRSFDQSPCPCEMPAQDTWSGRGSSARNEGVRLTTAEFPEHHPANLKETGAEVPTNRVSVVSALGIVVLVWGIYVVFGYLDSWGKD